MNVQIAHLRHFAVLLLIMQSTLFAYGQEKFLELNKNTFEFSPDSTNILDPIIDEIRSHDVVFLGEINHGDGSSHTIKYQLIKQLHKEANFAAIVFEGDFFALNHNMQQRSIAERLQSIYPVWTQCSQFQKIQQYIISEQIEVFGTDPRLVSPYSKIHLVPYLNSILPADTNKNYFLSEIKALQEKEYFIQRSADEKEKLLMVLQHYQKLMNPGFDHQLIKTIEAFAKNAWQGLSPKSKIFYRDVSMGENLFWLKSSILKGKKSVFFGANSHIGNTQRIDEKKTITTVKASFDAFNVFKSYSIAIIGLEGKMKRPTSHDEFVLTAYKGNGLEKTLAQMGLANALVNLRDKDIAGEEFYSWALFNKNKGKAVWSNIYDSFIYTRTVEPCGNIK